MVNSKLSKVLMALVLLLLAAGLSSAGIAITGAKFEKIVSPGDPITYVIQVKTDDSDPATDFMVDLFGIQQTNDGSIMELNASLDNGPYTARPFLKVSPSSFHLDPGKTQKVTLEGDIPNDVGSGGRYAMVKIHSLPVGKSMVGTIIGIKVPILLTINGSEIRNAGEIKSVELIKSPSENKQRLSLLFNNTGNCHFYPILDVDVKDKDGNKVASVSVPRQSTLLPGNSRLFNPVLDPDTPLNPGMYSINATVSMENGTVLANKLTPLEIKA
jgi:hypothetical protein